MPATAPLSGTASDDGLPAPATLQTTWSLVNGPGTVSFGNINALNTTATFSTNGVYTLRLTVNDGALSSSDDLVISVALADLIFADGFESGTLSAWSASTTDGGNLSVSAAASLVLTRGLQALINDNNAIYVTDNSPANEARYRARFYFDPNTITMARNDNHSIFYGRNTAGTAILKVDFRFSGGQYQIQASLLNDSTTFSSTSWFTISDAPHPIELDWQASTAVGANNGNLTLWIDGVQKATVLSIDNDTRRIDSVRLGAVAGIDTGTRGTTYLDAFQSRRQTYIGP